MKIVVAGATGMVGRALVPALAARSHAVTSLVRGEARGPDEVHWADGQKAPHVVGAAEAVINLTGANIAGASWTAARRRILRDSRVLTTQRLVQAMAQGSGTKRVLVNASATGFYGDTGDVRVDESRGLGPGFLAGLCHEWEAAALAAEALGVRVVCTRFGVILGPGGALARMAPLFRWGLGGRLGSGRQWMSWIALADVVQGIIWAVENPALSGPINLVSPEPVTNKEFTVALARAVHRPVGLPVPAFALELLYGRMADEALLAGSRVAPAKLVSAGFSFRVRDLQDALSEGLVTP